MNENFDSFHQRLDETIIGVIATDPITEYVHCLDGSIVVCDSPEAIYNWLQAHELDPASELEFLFYEDMMASLCEDGASYHLAAPAVETFWSCCAQDQRFHPEILHYIDDGWTLFTSVFNPYEDDPNELRSATNKFVIGYMANEASEFHVIAQADNPNASPLTYRDYKRLAFKTGCLDGLAMGRLESLEFWLWLLREYGV